MHQRIQMVIIKFSNNKSMLFNNNPKTTWTAAIKQYFLENGIKHSILGVWTSYSPYIKLKVHLRQCDMLNVQSYLDDEGYGRTLGKIKIKKASSSVVTKINIIIENITNGKTDN